MEKPLSNKEYLRRRGQICPSCRSENDLSGGFVDIDVDEARQLVTCGDCGHSWIDVYKLVRYFDLRKD